MKFSAVPMIYFRQMVLERTMILTEWFPIAASLHLDGTEIHDRSMASFAPEYVDGIGQAVADHGLSVSQFVGAADFTNPDPAVRAGELAQMRRNIDVAARLGATCVRATAGQVHPDVAYQQGVAWAVEGLRACVEYAGGKGVWIAYEDHYKDYFWVRPDFSQRSTVFLDILGHLRDVPLKINFDFGNPVMIGEDPIALLRQVTDRVVHVHCSDRFSGQYPHQIAGQGSVDFPTGFRILREAGYDGWLSSEYNSTGGLEGLRQSLDYIRHTWAGVAAPEKAKRGL
ncbi:MAG: TIM barrel protein [Anaerolineae bacterium]|nr:TIM barrel protein [Anaerolineae bacterium]